MVKIRDDGEVSQLELERFEEQYMVIYEAIGDGYYYTGDNDNEITDLTNRLDMLNHAVPSYLG